MMLMIINKVLMYYAICMLQDILMTGKLLQFFNSLEQKIKHCIIYFLVL